MNARVERAAQLLADITSTAKGDWGYARCCLRQVITMAGSDTVPEIFSEEPAIGWAIDSPISHCDYGGLAAAITSPFFRWPYSTAARISLLARHPGKDVGIGEALKGVIRPIRIRQQAVVIFEGEQTMSAFRDFVAYVQSTSPAGAATRAAPAESFAFAGPNEENGQGGGPSGGAGTLDATSTDLFFDWKSAKLTDSDKQALDNYAEVYRMAQKPKPVVVDAYASAEGDPDYNQNLSQDRADAVANYLRKKGVPVAAPKGHGAIGSLSDDLRQNRRATLKPPPLEHLVTGVEKPPNDKKPDPTLGEKAPEPDVPPPPPPPPETVTRAEVEQELTKWLQELGKSQKHKNDIVEPTKRVWEAEQRLHGLGYPPGEPDGREPLTPPGGEKHDYDAAGLARRIAQNLPDEVSKKNFDNFKALKPHDLPAEKSTLDQAKDWLDNKADELLSKTPIPKKYWKQIKDAVKNKVPDALDNLPVDPKMKDIIKQIYDQLIKGGDDK